MSIRQVRELPKRAPTRPRTESFVAKDVRDFIRIGYEAARVESEGRSAKSVATALKNYIKAHPEQCAGIGSCIRQGGAYLYREDAK